MPGSQPPLRPPSLEPPYEQQPFQQQRYQPPPGPPDQPCLRERMASLTEGVESLTTLVSGSLTTLLNPSESFAEGSLAAPGERESPDRAIGIVSELKSSAALFAAFAFGALNLPGTLTISESRVTSAASSVSTSRPVPDSDLLQAFVVLDAATFGFMLVCVVVSQQLLYRLGDGTYGNLRFGTEDAPDTRDSALGRLTTQYGFEFRMARLTFGLGLVAILLATVVKTWAARPNPNPNPMPSPDPIQGAARHLRPSPSPSPSPSPDPHQVRRPRRVAAAGRTDDHHP